ncbi:Kae1-associated kinase Bud32 [Candidatus Pacearchaeota archaeon CG10_big_fil_rev_8_21_14_0_10_35_219]|nr:Kae1-associated serine/threonine protein kinase [Candidatus Pacearchaeota archaeon]OIO43079.1 MAG: Kae1-associated kinase Bud32 [Candidatus Pacearchaeota archaeon CG1_02_32_21]PIO07243.1 MAG: Kae1-associated kinase Bud32 [Candidatus Pacearchaeota archaeon CG10_big_fil_rev_8_21_14_0_10_35_219]PIY81188.1 MAG: Kae1-associated kinase Bud32 [Candidatus Pacearchaeota archaeon CG_4_10_14_0_8_um_filter_35_169]PIZ79439.1 MAG: Kae1-associated kinase Bud32 [Candidatus Pacearchaeota archaeon CG_4_10_14_
MKLIARGAEAIIYKEKNKVIKDRIKKSYRHSELDKRLRKRRTKAEVKIMKKISSIIPCPSVLDTENNKITLQFIMGKKLSDNLEDLDYKKICRQIGSSLAKLHNSGIIHGDLTTSNLILKKDKVYFIDFGLSFHSNRIEDKAVDLHLIKQALEAKHSKIHEKAFKSILQGYKKSKQYKETLARLQTVEKRGRYKKGS